MLIDQRVHMSTYELHHVYPTLDSGCVYITCSAKDERVLTRLALLSNGVTRAPFKDREHISVRLELDLTEVILARGPTRGISGPRAV